MHVAVVLRIDTVPSSGFGSDQWNVRAEPNRGYARVARQNDAPFSASVAAALARDIGKPSPGAIAIIDGAISLPLMTALERAGWIVITAMHALADDSDPGIPLAEHQRWTPLALGVVEQMRGALVKCAGPHGPHTNGTFAVNLVVSPSGSIAQLTQNAVTGPRIPDNISTCFQLSARKLTMPSSSYQRAVVVRLAVTDH